MYTSLFLAVSDGDVGNPTPEFNIGWESEAGKARSGGWFQTSGLLFHLLGRISPTD